METYLSRALLDRLSTSARPRSLGASTAPRCSSTSPASPSCPSSSPAAAAKGAEDITAVIEDCFGPLLQIASAQGGELLKFGGDALLLFFDTGDHAQPGGRRRGRDASGAADGRPGRPALGQGASCGCRWECTAGRCTTSSSGSRTRARRRGAGCERGRPGGGRGERRADPAQLGHRRPAPRGLDRSTLGERALLAGSPPLGPPIVDVRAGGVDAMTRRSGVPVGLRSAR